MSIQVLKSVDVRLTPLGFPPFFTPQYCSCSVYFPNMFAFIHPRQRIWGAQAMDCLSRVGKGLNLFTPDIDPGQILTVPLHLEEKKLFQMFWRSRECVCDVCEIAEAALLNLKMNYLWEREYISAGGFLVHCLILN